MHSSGLNYPLAKIGNPAPSVPSVWSKEESMEMPSSERLSDQQHQAALQKAIKFRQHVTALALAKGTDAFFPELFRIAADLIEKDADAFCDRAAEVFEEIEAFGQEPRRK